MNLILIYQSETDGDQIIEEFDNKEELSTRVTGLRLHYEDYAIFDGKVVKRHGNCHPWISLL